MHILLIGQGAREHALAWKLRQSVHTSKLYVWPGNPAMASLAEPLPLPTSATFTDLAQCARGLGVTLVVCGPEAPLAQGLQDTLSAAGLLVFGPSREAAQLEASKAFAKGLMHTAGIPSASYAVSRSPADTARLAYQELQANGRVVLKASGLASGKGVFVCASPADVDSALTQLYDARLADAASDVVVESFLTGRECSYFSLIGPHGRKSLGFAVDFKRLSDGDHGPNTGGMGAYAPVPWLPQSAAALVEETVITPLLAALKAEHGIAYQGFLYVGLMWSATGPAVVEFNVRLGDPEAQVLAMQDQRDWLTLILEVLGRLPWQAERPLISSAQLPSSCSVGIVMTASSYPNPPSASEVAAAGGELLPRHVLEDSHQLWGQEGGEAAIFAGSLRSSADAAAFQPGSGRLLTVVARAASFAAARHKALSQVGMIAQHWPSCHWRQDIAALVSKEEQHHARTHPTR